MIEHMSDDDQRNPGPLPPGLGDPVPPADGPQDYPPPDTTLIPPAPDVDPDDVDDVDPGDDGGRG